MKWALTMLWPEDLPEPVWFMVGTATHEAIEFACRNPEATQDQVIERAIRSLGRLQREAHAGIITTRKRTLEAAHQEVIEFVTNWWDAVHPDSPNRMPIYDNYEYPPKVEVRFNGDKYSAEVDAIFTHKTDGTTAIVDWKTGGSSKADENQLQFYRYVMDEPASAWFHHLKKNSLQEASEYPGDDVIAGWINWAIKAKLNKMFQPFPSWSCDYCSARSVCPVFNDTQDEVDDLIVGLEFDEFPIGYEE